MANLREIWDQVCEIERKSVERNARLLKQLDDLENSVATMSVKTKHMRTAREHYWQALHTPPHCIVSDSKFTKWTSGDQQLKVRSYQHFPVTSTPKSAASPAHKDASTEAAFLHETCKRHVNVLSTSTQTSSIAFENEDEVEKVMQVGGVNLEEEDEEEQEQELEEDNLRSHQKANSPVRRKSVTFSTAPVHLAVDGRRSAQIIASGFPPSDAAKRSSSFHSFEKVVARDESHPLRKCASVKLRHFSEDKAVDVRQKVIEASTKESKESIEPDVVEHSDRIALKVMDVAHHAESGGEQTFNATSDAEVPIKTIGGSPASGAVLGVQRLDVGAERPTNTVEEEKKVVQSPAVDFSSDDEEIVVGPSSTDMSSEDDADVSIVHQHSFAGIPEAVVSAEKTTETPIKTQNSETLETSDDDDDIELQMAAVVQKPATPIPKKTNDSHEADRTIQEVGVKQPNLTKKIVERLGLLTESPSGNPEIVASKAYSKGGDDDDDFDFYD